jgi:ferredoxin
MERFVAAQDRRSSPRYAAPRKADSGKTVAVIGAGPAGLAAADWLLREGHRVVVIDRHEEAGGSLRHELAEGSLPADVLEDELAQLRELGAEFRLNVEAGSDVRLEELAREFAAVLLAAGASAKAQASVFGVKAGAVGLTVELQSGLTSQAKVFAAGSAVKPMRHVVRAMAEGRAAAVAIGQFLRGLPFQTAPKPLSSVMGRLELDELKLFLRGPSEAPRTTPALGLLHGFSFEEAQSEAGRCLHCDCRSVGNCALQKYAERYGADPGRFRQQRRPFEQHLHHGEIIFEPGKCILCGICVQLAEQAREPLGLTFIGRGFDVRLGVPLDRTIDEGLQRVGRECVEACPTGALAFKR